jgi:sphingosine-1-phosphate phosphatase 1
MYVGQALKDVVRENRPGPPSQKLQEKWANEFGLPSTHACAALSIPLSIVLFTMNK